MKKNFDLLFLLFIVLVLAICIPQTESMFKEIFFNEIFNKAISNNADEQFRLARMYQIGKFCDQSNKEAKRWYLEAANHGNDIAREILCNDFNICEVKNGYNRNN